MARNIKSENVVRYHKIQEFKVEWSKGFIHNKIGFTF